MKKFLRIFFMLLLLFGGEEGGQFLSVLKKNYFLETLLAEFLFAAQTLVLKGFFNKTVLNLSKRKKFSHKIFQNIVTAILLVINFSKSF